MTTRTLFATLFTLALLAAPLSAQVRPQPGYGDPHLQAVDFRADQTVLIEATPGYQVTVELAPDERVQTVALGDTAGWQVTANRAGNQLFVKPLQTGLATNMSVVTDVRIYTFQLESRSEASETLAYTVRFRYPPPPPGQPPAPGAQRARYRIGGTRALRPFAISDDGVHTYIDFPADADLPATYVLDKTGRETLVNGNMRGGLYVLDRVADRLIFRIDRHHAYAKRIAPVSSEKGDVQ